MNFIKYVPFVQDLPINQQVLIVIISIPILVWLVSTLIRAVIMNFVLAPIRRYSTTTETDLDDRALDIIERPIRVVLIGIAIAIISTTLQFSGDFDQLSDNISNSLIIAAIFYFLYNFVDIVGVTSENVRRFTGLHIEDRLLPFMRVMAKFFFLTMGALIVIQEFGYSITGLIASFGVIGLAISLAAQDTAANIIGFTSIISDDPFEIGDYIVTGDIAGTVEKVGVRTTRLRKLDQALVTIPNHSLTDGALTNWSRLSKRRLDFYIGLSYQTTASQMRDVLQQIRDMLKEREVIDADSVIVNFVEFDDSALNIRVIAYVLLADWAIFTTEQELINLEIMDIVEAAGVSMAFPSTSVYIESYPKAVPAKAQTNTPEIRVQQADLTYDSQSEIEQGKSEATYQDNEAASSESSEDAE